MKNVIYIKQMQQDLKTSSTKHYKHFLTNKKQYPNVKLLPNEFHIKQMIAFKKSSKKNDNIIAFNQQETQSYRNLSDNELNKSLLTYYPSKNIIKIPETTVLNNIMFAVTNFLALAVIMIGLVQLSNFAFPHINKVSYALVCIACIGLLFSMLYQLAKIMKISDVENPISSEKIKLLMTTVMCSSALLCIPLYLLVVLNTTSK